MAKVKTFSSQLDIFHVNEELYVFACLHLFDKVYSCNAEFKVTAIIGRRSTPK